MDKVYGVTFKENGKMYYFKSKDSYVINTNVITETEKGLQYGKIIKEITDNKALSNINDYKDILRKATNEDYKSYMNILKLAEKALVKSREIASELNLDMKIINASFTFDKSQLLINFLADDRVDFRELAKRLASVYRTRIELRQIGPRDKAREVGGLGPCGQPLCCARFLSHIESISMNMAKNQNLALNPTKINGSCGRLLCCLQYEDEEYTRCGKGMPYVGQTVKTKKGSGQVLSIDILNRKYVVDIDGERVEIELGFNEKNSSK